MRTLCQAHITLEKCLTNCTTPGHRSQGRCIGHSSESSGASIVQMDKWGWYAGVSVTSERI